MKNIIRLSALLLGLPMFAQFNISGTIKGYEKEPLFIKINDNGQNRVIKRVETNADGSFSYQMPMAYTGIISVEMKRGSFEIISDNTPIAFTADINHSAGGIKYTKGINTQLKDYHDIKQKYEIRDNTLMPLLSYYKNGETFHEALLSEVSRINTLELPKVENKSVAYYLAAKEELMEMNNQKMSPAEIVEKSKAHLSKDTEDLERFGLLPQFITQYISNALGAAKSKEDAANKIEVALDELLKSAVIDTPRGQNILATIIPMLEGNGFEDLATKYMDSAKEMNCEINENLKQVIAAKENIQVGKKAPDFKMVGTKAKSLYKIKADQKLLVFWASWCPHCMKEMPFVQEFYADFKKKGGEIIAISLDIDEKQYKNAIKDFSFINYSDLMKWDSPISRQYGINGTPTMILLDKDNKIVKIGSKISDFQ